MKARIKNTAPRSPAATDDEIRDYAFHLYEQNGCIPGRDLDNWLEAKACLEACVPKNRAHLRLHRHRNPEADEEISIVTLDSHRAPAPDVVQPLKNAEHEKSTLLLGVPPL